MKRLNNKGMTVVEVLICFILVSIIAMSLFSTISSYNQLRILEGYKSKIYSYKNELTKVIQDDFILRGLVQATYTRKTTTDELVTHQVDCVLKDGEMRRLLIKRQPKTNTFVIQYGVIDGTETAVSLVEYPLPNLGQSKTPDGRLVNDLTINNVLISITTKDDTNVLSIYIGFYHPELSTRYGVNIIAPIDFPSTTSDGTGVFNVS